MAAGTLDKCVLGGGDTGPRGPSRSIGVQSAVRLEALTCSVINYFSFHVFFSLYSHFWWGLNQVGEG